MKHFYQFGKCSLLDLENRLAKMLQIQTLKSSYSMWKITVTAYGKCSDSTNSSDIMCKTAASASWNNSDKIQILPLFIKWVLAMQGKVKALLFERELWYNVENHVQCLPK